MKNLSLVSLSLALSFGALHLAAQSPAPLAHASRSVVLAGAASGEASTAAAGSAESTLTTASGVAAVPLWASGALVQGSGKVIKTVGAASIEAGKATTQGAKEIWDATSGDPAARPALDRSVGIPARKCMPPQDPSPAEALPQKS